MNDVMYYHTRKFFYACLKSKEEMLKITDVEFDFYIKLVKNSTFFHAFIVH